MHRPPKHIRRQIRQLADIAAERDLRDLLRPLANDFQRWEAGQIDSFDLKGLIHKFHQGPAREHDLRWAVSDPAAPVAWAIATGILDRSEASGEVLADLAHIIEFMTPDEKSSVDADEDSIEATNARGDK